MYAWKRIANNYNRARAGVGGTKEQLRQHEKGHHGTAAPQQLKSLPMSMICLNVVFQSLNFAMPGSAAA